MLVIRCLCAIALIQNDTPTSEMIPLLEKRYLKKGKILLEL